MSMSFLYFKRIKKKHKSNTVIYSQNCSSDEKWKLDYMCSKFYISFMSQYKLLENGMYIRGNDRKQPASKMLQLCVIFDYILVGSATITCQDDGTWHTSPPNCTAGNHILVQVKNI